MSYQIVLLSGKQGSGKTSLQNKLWTAWTEGANAQPAHRVNFADIIYEMHDAVRAIGDKYSIPRIEPKDGPLLQLLGTEWGRNRISENVWVEASKAKMNRLYQQLIPSKNMNCLFIVGDCRFENEFDAFPQALRVRLMCRKKTRMDRCSMWRDNDEHPSETNLDNYARRKKFDLYLDTEKVSIESCASLVMTQLLKEKWKGER